MTEPATVIYQPFSQQVLLALRDDQDKWHQVALSKESFYTLYQDMRAIDAKYRGDAPKSSVDVLSRQSAEKFKKKFTGKDKQETITIPAQLYHEFQMATLENKRYARQNDLLRKQNDFLEQRNKVLTELCTYWLLGKRPTFLTELRARLGRHSKIRKTTSPD